MYRVFLVIIFLIVNTLAHAIEFPKVNQNIAYYGQQHGLSQPSITALVQDKFGYIWIGTQSGLNRFDGKQFKVFKSDKSSNATIPGNFISALCNFKDKSLWIGSRSGLSRYDYRTGKFKSYLKQNDSDILSNNIYSLHCTQNEVWVGTRDAGLYAINPLTSEVTRKIPKISKSIVTIANYEDRVFFSSTDGVFEVGDNALMRRSERKRLRVKVHNNIMLMIDSVGATINAFELTSDNHDLTPIWSTQLKQKNPIRIFQVKQRLEQYWVATDNGYFILDKAGKILSHQKASLSPQVGLQENIINDLLVDANGNIWLGSEAIGIGFLPVSSQRLGHIDRTTYTKQGMTSQDMRAFFHDQQGRLWCATSKGVMIYFQGKFNRLSSLYPILKSFDNIFVTQIEIINNQLWMTTLGHGVIRYDFSTQVFKSYHYDNPQITAYFNDIIVFNGEILVSSRGNGVLRYNETLDDFVVHETINHPHLHNAFRFATVENALWISSLGDGLFKFHQSKVQHLSTINGKQASVFYTLAIDQHNRVWAAMENGVAVLDSAFNVIKVINESVGIANEAVWEVVFDGNNAMWLGTSGGLSRVNTTNFHINNYGVLDGAQGLEYNVGASLLLDNGLLVIGGTRGFNQFYPEKIPIEKAPKKLLLTDLRILGEEVAPYGTNNLIKEAVESVKQINLRSDQDVVTLSYSAFNFENKALSYFYRIVGLSEQWFEITNRDIQVHLMDVEPGDFIIEVYAQTGSGLKSPVHQLKMIMAPPWWWNFWSKLLYCSILALILWSYYEVRRQAFKELECTVAKRTKELSSKNTELTDAMSTLKKTQDELVESEKNASLGRLVAGIAHEINTPLGVILTTSSYNQDALNSIEQSLTDKTLTQQSLAKSVTAQLESNQLMLNNINRMSELISSFKRVAVAQENQQFTRFKLLPLLNELSVALTPKLSTRNIDLAISGDPEITIQSSPSSLYQVIDMLIDNALIHAFEGKQGGKINIAIENNHSEVCVVIADDGVGITREDQTLIFEPFHTTKRNLGHCGLGLHIAANLVAQVLGGRLSCESTLGSGAKFKICLES